MPRQRRKGEVTCTCGAYPFPHRMMGGHCTGRQYVEQVWESSYGYGQCEDCHNLRKKYGTMCEVVDGGQPPWKCPVLAEFLDFEEVPVPSRVGTKSWV